MAPLPARDAWRRPAHEARVVLRTDEWTAVGFALGVVELVARDAEDTVVGHLGPDLLGPDWDEDEALRRLRADPAARSARRCSTSATWPASATCTRTSCASSAACTRGCRSATSPTCPGWCGGPARRSRPTRSASSSPPTGDLRRGEQTWVYRRDRQPCRRCGTRIRVDMQGPGGAGAGDVLVPVLPAGARLSGRSGGGGHHVAGATGSVRGRDAGGAST